MSQASPSTPPSLVRRVVLIILLSIGALLAFLILRMERGQSVKSGDDDAPAQMSAKHAPGLKHEDNRVRMDEAQIKAAGIVIQVAGPARIASVLQFPGEIQLNDDRTVHVVPRVPGIVEQVMVSTGQMVRRGQLLAVFSSQQIAEQRSQLLAAKKRLGFAQSSFEREKRLWEQKITAEQDYLLALQNLREAEIEIDKAQQKLAAIGVSESGQGLNRFELRAAYEGLVVERSVSVGEAVKEDTPIFTIADLSTVWAEVQLPAKDLPLVQVGGKLRLRASAFEAETMGTVAFIGALVGSQTRMAKARIVVANPKGLWRPGLFVNVEVTSNDVQVPVAIDSEALQTLGAKSVIFVRDLQGFSPHPVTLGRSDGKQVEILAGLPPGTPYAAKGSYVIKSEMTKLTAEESL